MSDSLKPLLVFIYILGLLQILSVFHAPSAAQAGGPLVIGVAVDGESRLLDDVIEDVASELKALLGGDPSVVFKRLPAFSAGWDAARAEDALLAALSDPETDVVLCAGVLTTLAAGSFDRRLPKPVISGVFLDPALVSLPVSEEGRSSKENFTFVTIPGRVLGDLEAFSRILDHGPIHVAVEESLMRSIPDLGEKMADLADAVGHKLELVPLGTDPRSFFKALPADATAVYLTPAFRMEPAEWRSVIDGLAERDLFTFTFRGEPDVRLGALAGLTPDLRKRLSRRIALHIRMILEGAAPSELPVELPWRQGFFLNMETAAAIGWSPPFALMIDAVLVDRRQREPQGPRLTISDAMETAVSKNPSITGAEAAAIAAEEAVGVARSGFLPQVESELTYQRIDADRADAALGILPRERLAAGVSLEQVIFDDSIISRYRRARKGFESAEFEREAVLQDVQLEAGMRYLALLSSESLLRSERENLELTRRNLALAELRREIGAAGPEEVLRFESLLSEVRSRVIERESRVRQAIAELNRSMGLNQSSQWTTVAISRKEAVDFFLDERFLELIGNPAALDRLRAFSVKEAMGRLRIRALEKQIESRDIEISRLQRRFYLPQLGATASYERRLSEQRPAPDIMIPGMPEIDPDPGENDWTVGVRLSFPLFEGGRRVSELAGARAELKGLQADLDRLRQATEEEVRNQLNALYHSIPNIALSRHAAESARKNFDVVSDKYARGAVSIIDLLDAQTQAITRDQAASVAVFAMVSDMLRYQRAISRIGMHRDKAEKARFMEQLEKFLDTGNGQRGRLR